MWVSVCARVAARGYVCALPHTPLHLFHNLSPPQGGHPQRQPPHAAWWGVQAAAPLWKVTTNTVQSLPPRGTAGGESTHVGLLGTPFPGTTPLPPRPTLTACPGSGACQGAQGRGPPPRAGPAVLDLCGVFPLQMPDLSEHMRMQFPAGEGPPRDVYPLSPPTPGAHCSHLTLVRSTGWGGGAAQSGADSKDFSLLEAESGPALPAPSRGPWQVSRLSETHFPTLESKDDTSPQLSRCLAPKLFMIRRQRTCDRDPSTRRGALKLPPPWQTSLLIIHLPWRPDWRGKTFLGPGFLMTSSP